MSQTTTSSGGLLSQQAFAPWGTVRAGSVPQTTLNDTGQRLDGTGLLYYHARYDDPGLGRFISADSVVPGSASGSLDGVALKPLTVDFHAPGFVSRLVQEHQFGPWFQLSDDEKQQLGSPWGPANPQALNRYRYVQNNPLWYTDPSGHTWYLSQAQAAGLALELRALAREYASLADPLAVVGLATQAGSIVGEALAAKYPIMSMVYGGAARLAGFLGLLFTTVGASFAHGVDQINELAYLIESANGPDGVALAYADVGIHALNRNNGTWLYLDTPIWMDVFLPDTLRPGVVNASPGEEFKGKFWFNNDIPVIRAHIRQSQQKP